VPGLNINIMSEARLELIGNTHTREVERRRPPLRDEVWTVEFEKRGGEWNDVVCTEKYEKMRGKNGPL